jgi:uncharacterized membrane protein YdcZ (DUF606 family)
MLLATLLSVLLGAPALVVAAAWLWRPDDERFGHAVFTAAGMWYVGLFGVAGVVYVFNTLSTISNYGG